MNAKAVVAVQGDARQAVEDIVFVAITIFVDVKLLKTGFIKTGNLWGDSYLIHVIHGPKN